VWFGDVLTAFHLNHITRSKLQRQNLEKHIHHMQRIEELLERIAKALEQRR
jgi:hypothetical protein